MLVQFTVENYRSFKTPCTLSMVASRDTQRRDQLILNAGGTKINLLRVAAIYGANAAGKSNFFKAFAFFRGMIRDSAKESQVDEPIAVTPFLFQDGAEEIPSRFEIVFILGGRLLRYGFACTASRITQEYLHDLHPRTKVLFERDAEKIEFGRSFKRGEVPTKPRANSLWLSLAALLGHQEGTVIVSALLGHYKSLAVGNPSTTQRMIQTGSAQKEAVVRLLGRADLNIVDLTTWEQSFDDFAKEVRMPPSLQEHVKASAQSAAAVYRTRFRHRSFSENGVREVEFGEDDESAGTLRLFSIAGPFVETIEKGLSVFADELDRNLHPLIVESLVSGFLENSTSNAQLVCSLHAVELMGPARGTESPNSALLRRDQIFLIEKRRDGSSDLYSLWDYGQSRKDEDRRTRYLRGFYRAIPAVSPFVEKD